MYKLNIRKSKDSEIIKSELFNKNVFPIEKLNTWISEQKQKTGLFYDEPIDLDEDENFIKENGLRLRRKEYPKEEMIEAIFRKLKGDDQLFQEVSAKVDAIDEKYPIIKVPKKK